MAQKWENLNPPWAAVHAGAPAAECEVGVAIWAVIALGSGWSFPEKLHPTGVVACACSQQDRGHCCDSSLKEKCPVPSSPTYCSLHPIRDSKLHPHYSDTGRKAAVGLPPALCCSGRGQQQEIKNCFSVASEPCGLNEPTNPAAPRPRCLAPEQQITDRPVQLNLQHS